MLSEVEGCEMGEGLNAVIVERGDAKAFGSKVARRIRLLTSSSHLPRVRAALKFVYT